MKIFVVGGGFVFNIMETNWWINDEINIFQKASEHVKVTAGSGNSPVSFALVESSSYSLAVEVSCQCSADHLQFSVNSQTWNKVKSSHQLPQQS